MLCKYTFQNTQIYIFIQSTFGLNCNYPFFNDNPIIYDQLYYILQLRLLSRVNVILLTNKKCDITLRLLLLYAGGSICCGNSCAFLYQFCPPKDPICTCLMRLNRSKPRLLADHQIEYAVVCNTELDVIYATLLMF